MRALGLILLFLPASAWAQAETGTIRGKITYSGPRPGPKTLRPHVNTEVCGAKTPIPDQTLIVSAERGLANAAVFLAGDFTAPPSRRPAVLGQKNCVFDPHVQTVTAGSELIIGNDDPIIHNVHARSEGETTFNLGMPLQGVKVKRKLASPGVVDLKCDSGHSWMLAYVVVVPHAHHSVSDGSGDVLLQGVPPGEHVVRVWHEKLGVKETRVQVTAGAEAVFALDFSAAEKTSPQVIDFSAPKAPPVEVTAKPENPAAIVNDRSAELGRRAADQAAGRPLFLRHCAPCHGDRGDGRGEAATYLQGRPANFLRGEYKFRSTASGELPTEKDLIRTISSGVPGTEMPAWGSRLDAGEMTLLARYLMTLSDRFLSRKISEELVVPPPPAETPAAIARGAELYRRFKCAQCHGEDGGAKGISKDLRDDAGDKISAADLQRGKYKSGGAPEDLYRTLMTGLSGTPMPAFAGSMTPDEAWDVVLFVRSLAKPRALERILGVD